MVSLTNECSVFVYKTYSDPELSRIDGRPILNIFKEFLRNDILLSIQFTFNNDNFPIKQK